MILFPRGQQLGGAEALLIHYLRFNVDLDRDRFLLVFLRHGQIPNLARELGYDVRFIEAKRLRNICNFLGVVWQLYQLFRSEDIRLVISWMSKAHLYGSLPALAAGIPSVWYQHGISEGSCLDRAITKLPAALIICCSKAAASAQSKLSMNRRIKVVYPAVDLARLRNVNPDRRLARMRLGLDWQGPVVAMFARFERWKGIDVFISSALQMSKTRSGVKYVVVGGAHEFDPDYHIEIENRVSTLSMGGLVLLVGQKPMDEVALWMTAADIVVHPATGEEPFGMVIVEAMAVGRPVIASRTGGIPEIIEDGVSGVLIAASDVEALTEATATLLDDPLKSDELAKNAMLRAKEFSDDRFVSSLEAVFETIGKL